VSGPRSHARVVRTVNRTARIGLVAAILSACFWTAKAVAIGWAGGLGLSPAEGPLFLLGAVSHLAAVACLLLLWTRPTTPTSRKLVALAALPVVLLGAALTRTLVWLVEPDNPGWPWAEANLWFLALLVLVLSLASRRVRTPGAAEHAGWRDAERLSASGGAMRGD